jgi:3-dehydroquinate synthase
MNKPNNISIHNQIEFGKISENSFESYLSSLNASNFAILCDENTSEAGLEFLITSFSILSNAEVIEIPAGEDSKCLEIYAQVLETLAEARFDRESVLINLGGGMITDLGGFVATTYKRGIRFLNLPTSLLAMVDASIGGKNGIDLGNLKNMIGTFQLPEKTFIDTSFLDTLPKTELQNGFAEMLKHALIANKNMAKSMILLDPTDLKSISEMVEKSARIKITIVENDPFEKGERAILNFGHTLGHAIESFALDKKIDFSHGYGVALGMQFALHLSVQKTNLSHLEIQPYIDFLSTHYPAPAWLKENKENILARLIHDKKNKNGMLKFVLLETIGKASYGNSSDPGDIDVLFDIVF